MQGRNLMYKYNQIQSNKTAKGVNLRPLPNHTTGLSSRFQLRNHSRIASEKILSLRLILPNYLRRII